MVHLYATLASPLLPNLSMAMPLDHVLGRGTHLATRDTKRQNTETHASSDQRPKSEIMKMKVVTAPSVALLASPTLLGVRRRARFSFLTSIVRVPLPGPEEERGRGSRTRPKNKPDSC